MTLLLGVKLKPSINSANVLMHRAISSVTLFSFWGGAGGQVQGLLQSRLTSLSI